MSAAEGRGLIIDLFAGGGGASIGIEAALGRRVDLAINHDAVAMAVHRANHPETRHLEADIWEVKPSEATGGAPVDLLWASPDCTHFSIAKGNVPREQGIRSLAWVVIDWAREVRPRVIFLENVQEFSGWGPLGEDGRPDKSRMGETFRSWSAQLERLGYSVDYRVLDASHYGAPTRRRRLFLVARRDGLPIHWPAATHGEGMSHEPTRTAAECIDWSIPCPSIFARRRQLAPKTLWRIAEGIRRFVLESPVPFLVPVGSSNHRGQEIHISALHHEPQTSRKKSQLVAAFIAKHFGGVIGHELNRPIGALTARDHHLLSTATLASSDHGTVAGHPRADALQLTCNRVADVRAFLTTYYGSGSAGQPLHRPARTITAKHRLGLVTVQGVDYQINDIGMRMLEPHELLAAQFGVFAANYDLSAARTKSAKVRLIGNSVCPEVAKALVAANMATIPSICRFDEGAVA